MIRIRLMHSEIGAGTYLVLGDFGHAHLINEWKQLWHIGKYNWYSFTLVYAYFEIDQMSRTLELQLVLLGVGFYLRLDRDFAHSEIKQRADAAYDNVMAGRKSDTGKEKGRTFEASPESEPGL